MKLAKYRDDSGAEHIGVMEEDSLLELNTEKSPIKTLSQILESKHIGDTIDSLLGKSSQRVSIGTVKLLAPIDRQEVWAAGVTYFRSKTARMDESQRAASFYDMVYEADRPEIFFKATPHRVVGPEDSVRVRRDSNWSVPEPELTLVLNSRLNLVGYTIGNDMSARDIEGANPLYLPQAKVYDACCALGPCIALPDDLPSKDDTHIHMAILREGGIIFEGDTTLKQMVRTYQHLIDFLQVDHWFPNGVFLMTGTGIVPPDNFSLKAGDMVNITISGIGMLANSVIKD